MAVARTTGLGSSASGGREGYLHSFLYSEQQKNNVPIWATFRPNCATITVFWLQDLSKSNTQPFNSSRTPSINMSRRGYAVEVTNLSPNTTEKDVYDFFALCGAIQRVEFVRTSEFSSTAYVTFRNPHAVETAVLLSGDTILDRSVCITQWGHYEAKYNQNRSSWDVKDDISPSAVPSAGKAASLAQGAVKTMAAKGYVLGKGAVGKAKAFGESHQVPAKVAELSEGIGLTGKIFAGVEAARSVDQRYHISGKTKSVVSATRNTAFSAANTVVSSSYFSKGALWLSGALGRASQVAGDLGSRGVSK